MCGLILDPLMLFLFVAIVARTQADLDYPKIFFIAVGVGLFDASLNIAVGGGFLSLFMLIPVGALLTFLLMKYIDLALQQPLIFTGLYFAYQILFVVLIQLVLR